MPLGLPELLAILVILIVIFGPKRLPQLGRQLGGGMREFTESVRGRRGEEEPVERPQLAAGDEPPPATPGADGGADAADGPRSAAH